MEEEEDEVVGKRREGKRDCSLQEQHCQSSMVEDAIPSSSQKIQISIQLESVKSDKKSLSRMSSISNLSKRKLDSSTSTSTSERERNPKHRKSNSSTPTSKTCLLPDVPLFSDKSARALSALTSKQALKSKDNPITNSRLGQNTQHYT